MATSTLQCPTVIKRTFTGNNDTTITIDNLPTRSFLLIFIAISNSMGLYATRVTSAGEGTVVTLQELQGVSSVTLSQGVLTVTGATTYKWITIVAY